MPKTVLQVVQDIYLELDNPGEQHLPQKLVLKHLSERLTMLKVDMQLSDRDNEEKSSQWFVPSNQMHTLTLDGYSVPTRVEFRPLGASDYEIPSDAPIVHQGYINESRALGEDVVAIFGNPVMISYSQEIDVLQSRQYRVWYEPIFDEELKIGPDVDSKIDLASIFFPYLKDLALYDSFSDVRRIDEEWTIWRDSKKEDVATRIIEWRPKWQKWIKMNRGPRRMKTRSMLDRRASETTPKNRVPFI